MSSSNSNAAARRRRAGGPPSLSQSSMVSRVNSRPQIQPPQQHQHPSPQQQQEPVSQQQRPVMTPAQMLIAHERRLNEIETMIPDIMKKVTIRETNVKEAEPNISSEVIDEMTQHIRALEEQFKALSQSFTLLHNFATETNIALLKLINEKNDELTQEEEEDDQEDNAQESYERYDFGTGLNFERTELEVPLDDKVIMEDDEENISNNDEQREPVCDEEEEECEAE